ncbi:Os06g0518850 [Oryza sativa Japonica Group]|uniref:Os06g0518850 protein n=2 Tax=Oryza sativa subsp. japonica TaxID=39947 RepID=Q5Z5T8_ORYSJ|nr:hypothetical protein [Oryza sativa Japonica Group]BAS97999.1 Os06g0518850 [Oryza sativa Japonica Group]
MGQTHTIWDGLGRSIEMDREGGLRISTGDGGYEHEGVKDTMHGDSKKSELHWLAHGGQPLSVVDGAVVRHATVTGLVLTTKSPPDRERVTELISRFRGATSSGGLLETLHELRDVAAVSEPNRKLLTAVPGTVECWSDRLTIAKIHIYRNYPFSADGVMAGFA